MDTTYNIENNGRCRLDPARESSHESVLKKSYTLILCQHYGPSNPVTIPSNHHLAAQVVFEVCERQIASVALNVHDEVRRWYLTHFCR